MHIGSQDSVLGLIPWTNLCNTKPRIKTLDMGIYGYPVILPPIFQALCYDALSFSSFLYIKHYVTSNSSLRPENSLATLDSPGAKGAKLDATGPSRFPP